MPVFSLLSTRQGQGLGFLFVVFLGVGFFPSALPSWDNLFGKVRGDGGHENAYPLYNHTAYLPDEEER